MLSVITMLDEVVDKFILLLFREIFECVVIVNESLQLSKLSLLPRGQICCQVNGIGMLRYKSDIP